MVAGLLATAGALLVVLLPSPATAAASADSCAETDGCAVPRCYVDTIYARAGLSRDRDVYCPWTDSVELTSAPEHGTISDVELRWGRLHFTHRADDDTPADDSFALRVSGPGGTRTQTVAVVVVPDSVNTAPICDPVEISERTLGSSRRRSGSTSTAGTGTTTTS